MNTMEKPLVQINYKFDDLTPAVTRKLNYIRGRDYFVSPIRFHLNDMNEIEVTGDTRDLELFEYLVRQMCRKHDYRYRATFFTER